jgi:hemoglobin-like flavoprotein
LFDKCGDARRYFEPFGPLEVDKLSQWHEQFTKLKQAVLLLLAYASLNENEEPTVLSEYAASHDERGIPRSFYEPFGECLIEAALRADRGWGGNRDDLREAWRRTIEPGIRYMAKFDGGGA